MSKRNQLHLRNVWRRQHSHPSTSPLLVLSLQEMEQAFLVIHTSLLQRPTLSTLPQNLPPKLARLNPEQWAELWHLLLQLQAEQAHSPVH